MAVRTLFPLIQGGNLTLFLVLPFVSVVTPAVPVVNYSLSLPAANSSLEVLAVLGSIAVPGVVGSAAVAGVAASVTLGALGSVNVSGTDAGLEVESELP